MQIQRGIKKLLFLNDEKSFSLSFHDFDPSIQPLASLNIYADYGLSRLDDT